MFVGREDFDADGNPPSNWTIPSMAWVVIASVVLLALVAPLLRSRERTIALRVAESFLKPPVFLEAIDGKPIPESPGQVRDPPPPTPNGSPPWPLPIYVTYVSDEPVHIPWWRAAWTRPLLGFWGELTKERTEQPTTTSRKFRLVAGAILAWPFVCLALSELNPDLGLVWFWAHQLYYWPFGEWLGMPFFRQDSEVGFESKAAGRVLVPVVYLLLLAALSRLGKKWSRKMGIPS